MNENSLDQRLRAEGIQSRKDIPDIVRKRIDRTLANLPEQPEVLLSSVQDFSTAKSKLFSKLFMRRTAIYFSMATICIVLIVGSAPAVPAMAKALSRIPILASILHIEGDIGLKKAHEQGVTTEINQSIMDNGINVKITDVLYDGSRLSIGYTTESLNGDRAPGDINFSISIDGKTLDSNRSGKGEEVGNTFAGVIQLIPQKELPESFNLNLDINHVGYHLGSWKFAFPVVKLNGAGKVKTFLPMISRTALQTSLTIKKVAFTPSATVLDTEMVRPVSPYGEYRNVHFHLIDEKGMIMQELSSSGYGNVDGSKEIMKQTSLYEPMMYLPKSIRVLPYMRTWTVPSDMHETSVVADRMPSNENPLVIELGGSDLRRVVITKIDYTNEATIVTYRMENSPDIFSQNLYIQDETDNEKLGSSKVTYIDSTHYEFETKYLPRDPKKQMTFVFSYGDVDVMTFDELEISIPIE